MAERLAFLSHLLPLAVAYVLALPIAVNRERKGHSAGLRTFPIVALATCGVVLATRDMVAASPDAMARIVSGLITGMGFIGGGAILKTSDAVHGTATAASLWVTGAIGVAAGLGSHDVAVALCVGTMLTLWLLSLWKRPDDDDRLRS